MKKFRITFQQTLEACFLSLNVEKEEALDRVAVNVVQQDCPEFLLPLKAVQVNGRTALKYRQPLHAVSLSYADLVMDKKSFVQLYFNLLAPFIKGRDWFLDYHNLYIDPAYVYIDSITKAAGYLYLPVQGSIYTDAEILQFFKSLLSKTDVKDNHKFVIGLFQYFEQGSVTISELYRIFEKEVNLIQSGGGAAKPVKGPVNESVKKAGPGLITPQGHGPEKSGKKPRGRFKKSQEESPKEEQKKGPQQKGSGFIKKKGAGRMEGEESLSGMEGWPGGQDENDEIMSLMFGDKPAKKEKPAKAPKKEKPLFGRLFGGKKEKAENEDGGLFPAQEPREQAVQPVYVPPEEFEDDVTVTVDHDSVEGVCCLRLVFSPTAGAPENIRIGQSQKFITIGRVSKDEHRPDAAFPAEFKSMGRRHARTVNHTYLNGEALIPNRPYELKAGSEVAFTTVNPVKYRVIME